MVGIVGGIGSGKSTVARTFAEHRRVRIIDGDRLGHSALNKSSIQQLIRNRFGDSVFAIDGSVDRKRLAALVFGLDDIAQSAKSDLEAILHPEIRKGIENQIAQAKREGVDVILIDAAVLFEAGWDELCDYVVFIDVPRELRLERVQSNRNWSESNFTRRESSQLPLKEKQRRSDFTVDNSSQPEAASSQLAEFISSNQQPD